MIKSGKIYAPFAVIALVCRFLLDVLPVEAVTAAQLAAIQWPVFLTALILGIPAVHFARRFGVKASSEPGSLKPIFRAFGYGFASSIFLIAVDVLFGFPKEMNVIGFVSVPYYVVGAFLVEIIQHLLPLVLWLAAAGLILDRQKYNRQIFWVGAIIIAGFEPMSQLGGDFLSGYPVLFYIISGILFYAINLFQFYLYRNNGFASMFAYRIGMYALWHIIWGPFRLQLLFSG